MGVQFRALDALLTPHAGLFWETIRREYPTCKELGQIVPQLEDFSKPGGLENKEFEIGQFPRILFEHDSHQWLVQLQRDRFLHNWRLVANGSYPRYEAVSTAFFQQWNNFLEFVRANNLGAIEPTQYEITYLNEITPWGSGDDIGRIFPDFVWHDRHVFLNRPESVSFNATFLSDDRSSRLRANARPAKHLTRGDVLLFDLTVRGFDHGNDLPAWFGAGREWIVRAFADLTSNEWHDRWGRIA